MVIRYRRVVDELMQLARHTSRSDDPVIRQRLADVVIGSRLMAMTFERVMTHVHAGSDPGALSSVSRLFLATFEQRLHELAVDLLGASGMLDATDADAVQGGRWTWGFLNTRASTIGAGTAEIQRTTIGERLLELPREPR
jgi:alkylation response protein AidB-like acyl-CoA dehydrogenase